MKTAVSIKDLELSRSTSFRLHVPRLRIKQGEIVCVTGPNGGGKTSLIECIMGLSKPSRGLVTINGLPVSENLFATRSSLGFIPDDEAWLIAELCAKEYFALLRKVYTDAGVQNDMETEVRELAQKLHFTAWQQQLSSLSHGNKKKVQIIAGLMHRPTVIVVDELRNGLDPLAILAAEHMLKTASGRGTAIVAATHDLWWAERIATHVILLVNGSVRASASTTEIVAQYGSVEQLFLHHSASMDTT
jgi:ABC-2 type transport system ATP-binding protein